ncbi:uncharacterized protein JN550_002090 [Neoarthrinium moseri]|uniref:uncharacterized protein n=1 Tax=Neoarthrinium moseri TaxID=1658444 RepID=UPI001FDD6B4D|nr:uncharacterized protein JN550_002090 [Neoarthrinium moseri]KAI1875804.1 hypothetical protein JN550_002090 [Neoarthrinium moseri]
MQGMSTPHDSRSPDQLSDRAGVCASSPSFTISSGATPSHRDDSTTEASHGSSDGPRNPSTGRQPGFEHGYQNASVPTETTPFDIFRALHKLAVRPNQQIALDAIHMSRPFVVTDVSGLDEAVIFVSDSWLTLTGYDREDILGKNCRILQSPPGKVSPGRPSEFNMGASAYELKQKIRTGQEIQHVILNYKKTGEVFMNMLTIIPISWDTPDIRFIFGFPTDMSLASLPANFRLDAHTMNVMARNLDLPDSVDAMITQLSGHYRMQPSNSQVKQDNPNRGENSQKPHFRSPTEQNQRISQLLSHLMSDSDFMSHVDTDEWNSMLLENTGGLVQVLSPKGTIVFISSSSHRLLGYRPDELLGTCIESICHPSDAVAALRGLKSSSADSPIELNFRLRRQDGQYLLFQNYGATWKENPRKWAVLVGYPQTMFPLHSQVIDRNVGFGDRDIWFKVSTSGLVLHVFPNPQPALGIQTTSLVGTMLGTHINDQSERVQFQSALLNTRLDVTTSTLRLRTARGHDLPTQMLFYPGETSGDTKPHFLLVQCRILKPPARGASSYF